MLERVGVVANVRARSGYEGFLPIVCEIEDRGWGSRVFTCLPDSVSKLSVDLIELIMSKQVQVILVYGGDGTLHKIVDILIYELARGRIDRIPPLVPIGGGTQKALFQWLGWGRGIFFHQSPLAIFRKVMLTQPEHFPARKMRPLAIEFHNERKGRRETHYGFIMIMGAMTRVIQLYDAEGKSPLSGLKHIGLGMLGSLTGWPRSHAAVVGQFKARMSADGQPLPRTDPLAVVFSVTESLLFGIEPFRGLAESNQFYAAAYCIPASLISSMVPIAWRATFVPPGDRFFNQPVFEFELTTVDERPIFVDGDFFWATPGEPIRIKLGPEIELVSSF